jgi:hypothetical protein
MTSTVASAFPVTDGWLGMIAPKWKRIIKWLGWLLGGPLAVIIFAYIVLLLINGRDQPPSAAALRLQEEYRNRPPAPDADNAFVYVMGFGAPPDADPREAGARRIEWIRTIPADAEYPADGDPVPDDEPDMASRSLFGKKMTEECRRGSRECALVLEQSDDDSIRSWIASEQWLLDRYLTLVRHPAWFESVPYDEQAPLGSYSAVADGHKLLLSRAYVLAAENKTAEVRTLLENDARFWRQVLASSDILITKMIAVAALNRAYKMGNLAVRRLPAESQLAALPQGWTTPLTAAERSMRRCLVGEWNYATRHLERIKQSPSFDEFNPANNDELLGYIAGRALMPLFKPQATSNLQAEMLIKTSAADQQISEELSSDSSLLGMLYNPAGHVLLAIAAPAYAQYPPRVTDVEGVRRAVVLAAELRARSVDAQNVSTELASSASRSPYTDEPFAWDDAEQAIVFIGMETGPRGRHAIKY